MKKHIMIASALALTLCVGGAGWMIYSAQTGEEAAPESVNQQTPALAQEMKEIQEEVTLPAVDPAQPQTQPVQTPQPTITEEDGVVTITPDWEAKSQVSHPVEHEATPNLGGGGGDMGMTDDTYYGEHPGESQPAPAPQEPAQPTPEPEAPQAPEQTQPEAPAPEQPETPAPQEPVQPEPEQPATPGDPPSYDGRYDGEISPDGRWDWWEGFGWVEVGSGSSGEYSDAPNSELSGVTVGIM